MDEDSSEVLIFFRIGFINGNYLLCVWNGVLVDIVLDMDGGCDYFFLSLEGYSKYGLKCSYFSFFYICIK